MGAPEAKAFLSDARLPEVRPFRAFQYALTLLNVYC